MKPIKAIAMGPMLVVVLLTGCGGGDGGSDSSSDESGRNDSNSLERSISYTTAYRGYCEFSDSSKREILIETNDLDKDFIILITSTSVADNNGYDNFTARAYINNDPITFSQYQELAGTIDGGDQWEGEFSRDRKTVTGTIDGGQSTQLGCDFIATLDNNPNNDISFEEDNVTIAGITIPLALNVEDEIFSQQVIEWNDNVTFSYLENNKKVISYLFNSGNYYSYSIMSGFWDVREDSNELWVLFSDGDLFRFEVTTDGNNYIQYITRINSDARLTHLVGEPSQQLLEQIAQDSSAINVPDTVPDEENNAPIQPAEFSNSLVPGTWEVTGNASNSGNIKGVVNFKSDTTITEISGDVPGIDDTDNWRVDDGKLYIDFIFFGSTLASQIFTITSNLGNNCYSVSGIQTNSGWQADYKMCKPSSTTSQTEETTTTSPAGPVETNNTAFSERNFAGKRFVASEFSDGRGYWEIHFDQNNKAYFYTYYDDSLQDTHYGNWGYDSNKRVIWMRWTSLENIYWEYAVEEINGNITLIKPSDNTTYSLY